MATRSSWLAKASLAVASLVLVIGIAEAAVRIDAARRAAARERGRAEMREAEGELQELTGRLAVVKPGARGIHKGVFVRTDDHGFRGPQLGPIAPGLVRLVVTGDSFTFGSGVAEADAYSPQLARLLDDARPRWRHEVINAGIPGGGIEAVMFRLQSAIRAYRPGLYVYGFTLNDIEGEGYELLARDERARKWLQWAAKQPLLIVQIATWRIFAMRAATSPAEAQYPRELSRNYLENDAAWRRILQGLDRFQALTASAGVCGHLLLHTQLEYLDETHPYHPIYARVAQAARARGLTVTDPFQAFEGQPPRSLWVNLADSHPNAEGHRILAEQLTRDLLALPERCWTRAERVTAGPARAPGRG